ncbi:hypothetical protein IC582_012934 [Cucumis melo]
MLPQEVRQGEANVREGESNSGGSRRRSNDHGNVTFRWPKMAENGGDAMEIVMFCSNEKLNGNWNGLIILILEEEEGNSSEEGIWNFEEQ